MKKIKINLSIKDYIFVSIVLLAFGLMIFQRISGPEEGRQYANVVVGEAPFLNVYIADTEQKRHDGLSGVEQLEFNQGMLFVHDAPGKHPYVMRGMLLDLDFIFIMDEKVVDIARNVAHEYPGEIVGGADYNKVLEVNALWTKHNNIKIGQHVTIK